MCLTSDSNIVYWLTLTILFGVKKKEIPELVINLDWYLLSKYDQQIVEVLSMK
jgi:hypothetical protein